MWEELAKMVSEELTGAETKDKYNYLLKKFRKFDTIAKTSGNGAITWRYYYIFKEFFKADPSICLVFVADSSNNQNNF